MMRKTCSAAARLLAAAALAFALMGASLGRTAIAAPESENKVNPGQKPDASFIYDTPISDLANADAYFDKQTVQVRGEVIGDRIWADADRSHCWLTLASTKPGVHDTISVYMPTAYSEKVKIYGAYGKKGTVLQVKGEFHLVSQKHDGASELVASEVSVVEEGSVNPDPFRIGDFLPGLAACVAGLACGVLYYVLRERGR